MGDGNRQEITPANEKAAEDMLKKASSGDSITVDYNKLSSDDQKQVFDAMRNTQAKGKYSDVTITGTDDGKLGDAQTKKGMLDISKLFGSPTIDTYDTPQDIQKKLTGYQNDAAKLVGGTTRQSQLDKQEQQILKDK